MRTVEPASALPRRRGLLSAPGDPGSLAAICGACGAVESSTYDRPSGAQAEVLPAASVAVAYRVLVLSAATEISTPVAANVAALPCPAVGGVQPAVV